MRLLRRRHGALARTRLEAGFVRRAADAIRRSRSGDTSGLASPYTDAKGIWRVKVVVWVRATFSTASATFGDPW